jgi:hypothetical protein
VALTLLANYCRHLRTLVCANDSAFCTIASSSPIDPTKSSVTDVLARAHPSVNANSRATTHIRNRVSMIARHNKHTLQSITLPQLTTRVMNGRTITALAMCSQLTSLSVLSAPHDNDEQRSTMKSIVLALRRCAQLERLSLCTSLLYYRRPAGVAYIESDDDDDGGEGFNLPNWSPSRNSPRLRHNTNNTTSSDGDDKNPNHAQDSHLDIGAAMRAALLSCADGTRQPSTLAPTQSSGNSAMSPVRTLSSSPSLSPSMGIRRIGAPNNNNYNNNEFMAPLRHLCLAGSRVYLSQRTISTVVAHLYGLTSLELLSMSSSHLFPMNLSQLTSLESLTIYAGNGALVSDDRNDDRKYIPSLPASLTDWTLPSSLRQLVTNTWNELFPCMSSPYLQSFNARSISLKQFEAIISDMRALKQLRFHNVRVNDSKEVADLSTYDWYPSDDESSIDGMHAMETLSIHCSLSLGLLRCTTMYTSRLRYCVVICPRLSIDHVAKIITTNASTLEVLSVRLSIHAASTFLVNPPERPYVPQGPPIELPRLEELTLEVASPELLSHLVCPVLRSLTLYGNASVLPSTPLSMASLRDLSLTVSSQCVDACNMDDIIDRLATIGVRPSIFHLNTNDIAMSVLELVRLSEILSRWPISGAIAVRRVALLSSLPLENDTSSLSMFTDELMSALTRLVSWTLLASTASSVIIPTLPVTTRWDLRNITTRLSNQYSGVLGAANAASLALRDQGPRSPRRAEENDQRLLVMLGMYKAPY